MENAQKLLAEWQKRLGLQEWRIKLYTNCTEEETDESSGLTVWQEVTKTARIMILDPKYYGERIVPFDFEKTLVHELLHLKTCLLTSNCDDLQERVGHMLIDDISRALIDAKRFKKTDS